MIPIEKETKRIDWNAIRAEYVAGGVSLHDVAKKYELPFSTVQRRSRCEGWRNDRENAKIKVVENVVRMNAEKAADNATIAADLKKQLLLRLQRIETNYPHDATEVRTKKGEDTLVFRIRDLTGAFRDLTGDLAGTSADNELLQSLLDMERRAGL